MHINTVQKILSRTYRETLVSRTSWLGMQICHEFHGEVKSKSIKFMVSWVVTFFGYNKHMSLLVRWSRRSVYTCVGYLYYFI